MKRSLTSSAGAGLASAVICIVVSDSAQQWLFPGAIFGVAIVSYLALIEGYRTPLRFLAFVCTCSASYPLSILGAFGVGILLRPLMDTSSQSNDVPQFYLFIGGGIGACIILFSGVVLFGPTRISRQIVGATLVCIFVCGLLALVGGMMDGHLGRVSQNGQAGVFLFWQTGVAMMLGLLLQWTRKALPRDSGTTSRGVRVAVGFSLVCILVGLSLFIWSHFSGLRREQNHAALISQLKAREPPLAELKFSAPSTAEQLFVLRDIGTLRPLLPQVTSLTTWKTNAPTMLVSSIGYGLSQANSMPTVRRKAFVQVLRLPNVDWARYEDQYISTIASIDCDRCVSHVTKFGAQVTRIVVRDDAVAYLWSSDSTIVSVTNEELVPTALLTPEITSGQEDVLRLYLEKYPVDKK